MTVKKIFGGLLLAILLSMGWRYGSHGLIQDWLSPSSTPEVNIQFDKLEPPSAGPMTAQAQTTSGNRSLGGMRKCKRGNDIIYTDGECPSGAKEINIRGGSVTVVPSQAPAKSNSQGESRPANVRELLTDPKKDAELRDRMMERAINR